jgi:ATP-dependent RNA helicase SUPV3L1/SUV3
MSQLTAIYPEAIEHTKRKVLEDIDHYLENKERIPSYEQYIVDRSQYIEQIWVNVWLNKATNAVAKHEKKAFLSEKGYVTEGVDRKLINRLFRNEMRSYQPFDVISWVNEYVSGNEEDWKERYETAQVKFQMKEEDRLKKQKKASVRIEIEKAAQNVSEEEELLFYLYVRHYIAKQLVKDLAENPKYQDDIDTLELEEKLVPQGSFNAEDYRTVGEFLDELTGDIHKTLHWGRTHFEYETYYFRYERMVSSYLYELVPFKIIEKLPENILHNFKEIDNGTLDTYTIKSMIVDHLDDYLLNYIASIQDEYLSDLIEIAELAFDPEIHKEIFKRDLDKRELRKVEELAEIERRKEEETRMIEDIFGREYRPSIESTIRYVLHIGETNTGKTHHALERMKKAQSGLYLAPLRLLALEVYDRLNAEGIPCSLKTGEEEKIATQANHISCTVEMFHEKDFYEVVVIDESQMIADKDRGFSWYKAITKASAKEVHIIGSRNIKNIILELLGDSDITIHEYTRDIPLQVESGEFSMNQTKKGDALVCFSRRQVLETASRLQNSGHSVSMIYGSMPPETRKKQIQHFIKGETKVIVATDAIGMGLNLPIRRIVFLENEKFDGTRRRRLTSQEIKQIAGRAGRKGLYDVGKVAFTSDIKVMERLLKHEDQPVLTFAIAPTTGVFERFQKYYRSLGSFFEMWARFESPKGTNKASLSEERELYELIRDSEIEARLSMMDLYGYLHLPFSKKEQALTEQWRETMVAIVKGLELPEPIVKASNLEELELSYKAIGLHLMFLYRLEKPTEAIYWERLRQEISDDVHEQLKTEVKNYKKKCKHCGKKLSWETPFQICDDCHSSRPRKRYSYR